MPVTLVGDEIIPVCNLIQQHFDLVVATQDWHPDNHKSFARMHSKPLFEKIDLNGLQQVLWPDHCVQGTKGAEICENLHMNKVEAIFRKGTDANIDSYSGFYDNGHRKSTGLADYLRGKSITEVYVAGLAADYCVYFTAADALDEGFATFIIDDAVRAISKDGYENAKQDIINKGGRIIYSTDIAD